MRYDLTAIVWHTSLFLWPELDQIVDWQADSEIWEKIRWKSAKCSLTAQEAIRMDDEYGQWVADTLIFRGGQIDGGGDWKRP